MNTVKSNSSLWRHPGHLGHRDQMSTLWTDAKPTLVRGLDQNRRNQTRVNGSSTNNAGTAGLNTRKRSVRRYGKTCYKCGKNNHYQKLCRAKHFVTNSVHEINNDGANNTHNGCENACSSEREFFIDTVSASNIHITPDRAFVPLYIGPQKKQINFKIDTGSSADILPYKEFKSLNIKQPLQPPHHKLTSYTGNMLPVMGMVRLACVYKSKVTETMFNVVEGNAPPWISLQTSID